jgi:hypothetical protein
LLAGCWWLVCSERRVLLAGCWKAKRTGRLTWCLHDYLVFALRWELIILCCPLSWLFELLTYQG